MVHGLRERRRIDATVMAVLIAAAIGASAGIRVRAQRPEQVWEKAAGGRQQFEVAAIKLADPKNSIRPNIGLNIDDGPGPPGGHFLARGTLPNFIEFAYRVMLTRGQEQSMIAKLPKWVGTQAFVIEAKAAAGSATNDQMRLMTQSLLANRFGLKMHFENKRVPVLAMVLVKPGEPGPRLRPHSDGLPCDAKWAAPQNLFSQSVPPGEFIPVCGSVALLIGPHHTFLVGGRNISLDVLALHLPGFQDFGKPVVNRTGLSGTYDFSLYSTPDEISAAEQGEGAQLDLGAPSFTEALKEQLGMKLEGTKASVETIVIDRVEMPTAN